jgi:serine/threonine protein kinase/Tfp pilus assembly protein PilF
MMTPQSYKNQDNILEEALKKFVDAHLGGEQPDIDELVEQYPECEGLLRQRIQDLHKINNLFDSLVQADQSEFEDAGTGEELVGEKIGSFEIVEIIGRGGMGVVYLARDTKLDRSVAIKSMPSKLTDDSTTRMRLGREAKLLASLNHPNIAVIHDIIEQDKGTGYLVLEYVPGETLTERIAREPLTLEQALSIGQQIAEAVSVAHKKGIVHRDLKPSNIKITPESRVKVLDFGLAKVPVPEGKSSEITATEPGRIIGTPAYMSPEQARGKSTDHRTDIWSFGCIMYQMLTGHFPFEGETASDTLAHIIERQPDWEALPQETPENIRALLQRCLEKEPDQRLDDITDAAIEVAEALSNPVTAPARLRRIAMIISAVAFGIILSGIALRFIPQKDIGLSSKQIRLAVLPFENLGSAEDEYFADGITDEITARLASIHGLGVISRQSAMQYKNTEKGAQQIAEELSVDYILEGTVRRERPSDSTSRVRIIPQLIRASDDTHVWAQTYDNDMSKVFQVQSEVAERVAQALNIALLEPERRALASRPTENMEAYDYYMRGNEYMHRSVLENDFRIAIRMYEKAVELDPTFASAYAQLSRVHSEMYWFIYDRSEERLEKAKDAIEKALELDPDLPEVHLALGQYYYHGHREYDRALEQFAIVRKNQPNNSEPLSLIGAVKIRQGKFEEGLTSFKKASELDPLSNVLATMIATTCVNLRKYPEAERYYERAIELAPDIPFAYYFKAQLYLFWEGSTKEARAVLEEGLKNIRTTEIAIIVNLLVDIDVYDGHYQEALTRLSSWTSESFDTHFYFIPKALLKARINGLMGNRQRELAYYESARGILEAKIKERPDDARLRGSLGIAYAGLGRKKDAIREGKLGVKLLSIPKATPDGGLTIWDLALIYVMVGEFDAAIDQLEYLLSRSRVLSTPLIQIDPNWKPLSNHPRFKKLVEAGK